MIQTNLLGVKILEWKIFEYSLYLVLKSSVSSIASKSRQANFGCEVFLRHKIDKLKKKILYSDDCFRFRLRHTFRAECVTRKRPSGRNHITKLPKMIKMLEQGFLLFWSRIKLLLSDTFMKTKMKDHTTFYRVHMINSCIANGTRGSFTFVSKTLYHYLA